MVHLFLLLVRHRIMAWKQVFSEQLSELLTVLCLLLLGHLVLDQVGVDVGSSEYLDRLTFDIQRFLLDRTDNLICDLLEVEVDYPVLADGVVNDDSAWHLLLFHFGLVTLFLMHHLNLKLFILHLSKKQVGLVDLMLV